MVGGSWYIYISGPAPFSILLGDLILIFFYQSKIYKAQSIEEVTPFTSQS